MSSNSDPLYEQYADMDFTDAMPVADVPALAKLQAEQSGKSAISIRVDNAILSAIKAQAKVSGADYRALISDALRQFVEGRTLAQVVRETIREELHPEN
ncbi:MAG: BrnA antitoxin family protein [Candidatus Thiosymbion ectosymbiont of Robbea hypermnestra]|nr:BrnA antitoxin family protein [Candidatus Thiosymbion ectosymbiont of Robbea hypermnestra]